MPSPARLAGVGAFVIAGLLLFTIGLFMIGDRQMAFARKFTIFTEFTKITGLQPGSIVRVSGAKAGAIKQIITPRKPSDKFRVQIVITEALHPLVRTDSLATIETEGLVGGSYLGIGTGSDTAPAAPPDSTIPSKEPFEIADLMEQMRGSIKRVNDTIDEMKYDVQRAVVSVADTVDLSHLGFFVNFTAQFPSMVEQYLVVNRSIYLEGGLQTLALILGGSRLVFEIAKG